MLLNPTVLITGASAGIGRATALVLAQANATVIATARNNEALLELSRECAEMGQPIRTLAGDLNDSDFIRALTLFAGEVDVLVNNAGVLTYAPILEIQPDDYVAMFNTNVFATLALTQAVAQGMLARGRGHLIMVTSTGAREVFPFAGAYCASKHAISAITRSLRLELQPKGIRVSEVAPGLVDTQIRKNNNHPEVLAAQAQRKTVPLTVDDVANTIAHVALSKAPSGSLDFIELRPFIN
jgi:NADP-dependent 3-hydroxy acid dehydrogenase YdfG